jgi:hypothetical protein
MGDELPAATEPVQGAVSATKSISSGKFMPVIVRRCDVCIQNGIISVRTVGEPCGTCGNPEPPETTELGVVSAVYRNPIKRAWWKTVREPLANRRIRRAGARTLELRENRGN